MSHHTLKEHGYADVRHNVGGDYDWESAGYRPEGDAVGGGVRTVAKFGGLL